MNWKTLLEQETELWNERINTLKEHGNKFTYQELSDIWGVAPPNVSNKINDLISETNGLIMKDTSTTPYTIVFNWDREVEEPEPETEGLPSFIKQHTYENVLSYLEERGIWDEGCELVFKRNVWEPRSQRGGLVTILLADGLPALEFEARFDNGLIIKGSGRIGTVSSNTIRNYISGEMEQAGRTVIASYFEGDE